MPHRQRSAVAVFIGAAALFSAASMLSGCAAAGSPSNSQAPTTAPIDTPAPTQPMNTSEFGGEGAPAPSDGSEVIVPTQSPDAGPKVSELTVFDVGDDDMSDLDWHVSCSGLESNPTVIASTSDGDTDYTLVLLGASTTSLNSLTLTASKDGASSHTSTGITVNPGASQGNGSLEVDGSTITSTGRGVEVGPDAAGNTANIIYSLSVSCAAA